MSELYCGMCSSMKPNVAYSVDWSGYICDPCDRKLYEKFTGYKWSGVLTWGGWR